MFCESYDQALRAIAISGEGLPPKLAEHLRVCDGCGAAFGEERKLIAGMDLALRLAANGAAPDLFVAKVRAQITASQSRQSSFWGKIAIVTAACAVTTSGALFVHTFADKSGDVPGQVRKLATGALAPLPPDRTTQDLNSDGSGKGSRTAFGGMRSFEGRLGTGDRDRDRHAESKARKASELEVLVLPEESANLELYMHRFSERAALIRPVQVKFLEPAGIAELEVARMDIDAVRIRTMEIGSDD